MKRASDSSRYSGRPARPLWRLGFGPALLAVTVAVVVAVSGLRLGMKAMAPAPFTARLAATLALADPPKGPVATVALDPRRRELTVDRLALTAVPGHARELWLIVGPADPMPLGLLPDTVPVTLPLSQAACDALRPGALLAISDEPAGGSPGGRPSGAVLASGVLVGS